MQELLWHLRREPEGALLVAANAAGLVLTLWLVFLAS